MLLKQRIFFHKEFSLQTLTPIRFLLLFLLSLNTLIADDPLSSEAHVEENIRKWLQSEFEANKKRFKGGQDVYLAKGLVANRKTRTIDLLSIATGLSAGMVAEFFIISPLGRDHEALLIALAKPSDIHQALLFIGMKPGRPVDYHTYHFWPKGERVIATVHWNEKKTGNAAAGQHSVRLERLVYDKAMQQPMEESGLMFTGSRWQPDTDHPDQKHYLADRYGSIASSYNDPFTVLDIPSRSEQGAVYGQRIVNKQYDFLPGQKIRIRIRPERNVDNPRVLDYQLFIKMKASTPISQKLPECRFVLRDKSGKAIVDNGDYAAVLTAFKKAIAKQKDIYLQIQPASTLSLTVIQEFYAIIKVLLQSKALRLDPMEAHPYFEAFLGNKEWKERSQRIYQPIEIHLKKTGRQIRISCIEIIEEGIGDKENLKEKQYHIPNQDALEKWAKEGKWTTRSVFFYVDKRINYGELLPFYRAIQAIFPIVYIYPISHQ